MTDNRFGVNKFGATKFGASSTDELLAWGVEVDWDGDGVFDGSNEASRMTNFYSFRGRKNWLRAAGDGFESLRTGNAAMSFHNEDGRYDGWNSGGALYPNVESGKDVKIRVRNRATGTVYNVFRGVISKIDPGDYGEEPSASIEVEDGWRFLRDYPASVALKTSISPDTAMGYILDDIGWPERWGRSLDVAGDTIYYWWADANNSAGSELEQIANSFLHNFFLDNIGQARLLTRTGGSYSRVTNYKQEQLAKRVGNPQPQENLRTVAKLKVHPRSLATLGPIYVYAGNALSLAAGETLNLFVDYSYNGAPCPATNVVSPVAGTDWGTNTASDGSGTDKTANATMTFSDLGATGKYTITNNDAGTVYVVPLQVRGQAVYEPDTGALTYPADPSGIENPRQFVLDLKWQQDVNAARDFVDVLGAFLTVLHPFPVIQIENRPALQYGVDLFDLITLSIPYLGIGGVSFRVGGIEHQSMGETCQKIRTKLYLEPYISAESFMRWDVASVWDTSTVFGY